MDHARSFLGGKEIHEFISGLVRALEERIRTKRRAYVGKTYFPEKDWRSRGKSFQKLRTDVNSDCVIDEWPQNSTVVQSTVWAMFSRILWRVVVE